MRTRTTTTIAMSLVLLLGGCGGGDDTAEPAAKQAPSAKPAAAADPKAEWMSAVIGLCTTLAGAVSGAQLQAGMDGKITPSEVLKGEKAARPAVDAFDAGLAALTAPPEAAAADKALKDLYARNKPSVAKLLAAAEAGDQAALNKVFAEREGIRIGPKGIPSLTAVGLPEKCNYRSSYS